MFFRDPYKKVADAAERAMRSWREAAENWRYAAQAWQEAAKDAQRVIELQQKRISMLELHLFNSPIANDVQGEDEKRVHPEPDQLKH